MDILAKIEHKIGANSLFFVCRDVERAAAGLELGLPNFFVITNSSPYAKILAKKHQNLFLIKEAEQLDTHELILHQQARQLIKSKNLILVFKPTKQIEEICKKLKVKLINPPAKLASEVEEKISQVKWLGPLKKYLPGYQILPCKKIVWPGNPFILQFNHSHTGSGTILVKSKSELEKIKIKFPLRPARIAKYISGPLFTNNNIVWGNKILQGNLNYQITGLKPFTEVKFATIGNDWSLPNKILTKNQNKKYSEIAKAVGKKLIKSGWIGLYGIDTVLEEKTGKLYLLEINARQPASTTLESELQFINFIKNDLSEDQTTSFAAHLAALLKVEYKSKKLIKIKDGAQIILRKTKTKTKIDKQNLQKYFKMIEYSSPKENGDWLRLQSQNGIMLNHNKFNKLGKKIIGFTK